MKIFINVFILFFMIFEVTAQSTNNRARTSAAPNRGIEDISAPPILGAAPQDIGDLIEYQLLNSDNLSEQINWPALPRIWAPRYISKTLEGEVSVGALAFSTGVKASFNYKYNVKTTLWLISSTRPVNSKSYVEKVSYSMNDDDDFFIEGDRGLLYPNVRDEFPIVGLCIYEVSLDLTNSKKGFFDFFGNGFSLMSQDAVGGSFATWSNFFNTKSTTAVSTYLSRNCEGFFNKNVKDYTERNFSKLAVELYSMYNPKNTCSISAERTELGDSDCMAWHARRSSRVREATVPRCEMNQSGVSKCVLKSARRRGCTLWQDDNDKLSSTNPDGSYKLATNTVFNNECDYGLTCRIQPVDDGRFQQLKNSIGFKPKAICE